MRYSLDKNPHTFQESYMELDGGGVVIDLYSSSGGSITPKLSTLAYIQYGDSARRGEPFPHTFYMPHIFCMTIEDTNLYHLTSRPVLSIYLIHNI